MLGQKRRTVYVISPSPASPMPTDRKSYAPGMRVLCRDAEWLVTGVKVANDFNSEFALACVGTDDLVRGHEAVFLTELEKIVPIDPRDTVLEADQSPGFEMAKLFLEAQLRQMPCTDLHATPHGLGAFKPMGYQLDAVHNDSGKFIIVIRTVISNLDDGLRSNQDKKRGVLRLLPGRSGKADQSDHGDEEPARGVAAGTHLGTGGKEGPVPIDF